MAEPDPAGRSGALSVYQSYLQLDRRVWWLAAARGINTMGFSIVMPFMAMYLVEKRHVSGAVYGLVYLAAGLAAAVGHAGAGEASDVIGRRRVMLAALALRSLNMVALGIGVVERARVEVLAGLIVFNAVLRAMFEPAASAAVTDLVPVHRRTAAFGLQRIGVNLGWALGPALGGALAAAHSYGALFFAAAGIMGVAALATSRVRGLGGGGGRPHVPQPRGDVGALLGENRAFLFYLVLVFLGSMMTVQLFATLSVYAKTELGLSVRQIGLLYTVNGVLVVLLQVPAVAFIDAKGPKRALVIGPLLYTLSFLAVGQSASFPQLAFAVAVLTAGEVVFAPALSDMAAHLGDPRRLGRAFGLMGLMQQLGLSMGPLFGGIVYDHLRHQHASMWGVIAVGMAVTGAGYLLFTRVFLRPVSP